LREKRVPEMEGEVWVCAAEASDEMVLEGVDSTFSGVTAVDSWRD
jgi:hypothetical protein